MAGELENVFLKIGEGDSVLVEGGAEAGKEFFCRLLLRQALDADLPVAVVSFHPEAHLAWFREYAKKKVGMVRHAEAPDSLTEMGIALSEHGKGARFAYVDFFEILSAKFEPGVIIDAIAFNAKRLKAGKASLLLAVSPESAEPKQMARLREIFDVVIEVRRKGDRMEYRHRKHPVESGDEWRGFSFSEAVVPSKTLAEFCLKAIEYELRNAGHYARNLHKFDDDGRKKLFRLSQDSTRHFLELVKLLEMEAAAAKTTPAEKEELLGILEHGLLEERVMKQRYLEYAAEAGDAQAKELFEKISGEEKIHEEIVQKLREKFER